MPLNRRNFLKAGCTLPLMSIAHQAAAADDTAIDISITPSIFESMFSQLTSGYNLANPSRKALIREANRDQSAQLQATLRQALTHDLPDVSFQGFSYLATLKDQGILQPINEFVAAPELATLGIAGPGIDACRVGDDACGVAVGLSFPVFFVNATIAERAGFPRDALPGDWTGILDMARKIAALSADVQGGYFQYQADGNWTWVALIEAAGGRMLNADGSIAFAGEEGKHSLTVLEEFGRIGQARYDVSRDQARTVFNAGQLGLILDSSSSATAIEKAVAGAFEVATIPLPIAPSAGRIPAAGVAAVLHAQEPARRTAAWEFMKFCASPQGQTIVGRNTGYVPPNAIALKTPAMLGDWYSAKPIYKAGLASAANASPWFIFPGRDSARVSTEITEILRQVVMLQKSPEGAMEDIVKTVKRLVPGT